MCLELFAQMHEIDFVPRSFDSKAIEILDAKKLKMDDVNGLAFAGISDLAYDKEHGLFALSDKGYAFRLDLEIKNNKLHRLDIKDAFWLKNKKGKPFSKKKRDAEGMDFHEDSLVISFERRPRVTLFELNGLKIKDLALAPVLEEIKNYQGKNSALESVTMHPVLGMITAAQKPLRHLDKRWHTLFIEDRRVRFKADADVTAIQSMPDGSLLILEREFHLFALGHTVWLKRVPIMECSQGASCPVQVLATLKSSDGWKLDNFEGLTHIRDDIYMMISDDNESFLQSCIVVLFQVR